mmetsp:Transcript_22225/g.53167  ORF Transcript_22225/g.53167 Transcript_22225/m.53167 type:complete len:245 (+) Transcript_22225:670-1404(+)
MKSTAWAATAGSLSGQPVAASLCWMRRCRKLPAAGLPPPPEAASGQPPSRAARVRDMASRRSVPSARRTSSSDRGSRPSASAAAANGRTSGTRTGATSPMIWRKLPCPTPAALKTVAEAVTRSLESSVAGRAPPAAVCVSKSTPKAALPTTSNVMSPNMRHILTSLPSAFARRTRSFSAPLFIMGAYSERLDGLKVGCQAPRRAFACGALELMRLALSISCCSREFEIAPPRKGFILSEFLNRI